MDCETLLVLSSQRVHGAVKERMLREIMRVEQIEYGEVSKSRRPTCTFQCVGGLAGGRVLRECIGKRRSSV